MASSPAQEPPFGRLASETRLRAQSCPCGAIHLQLSHLSDGVRQVLTFRMYYRRNRNLSTSSGPAGHLPLKGKAWPLRHSKSVRGAHTDIIHYSPFIIHPAKRRGHDPALQYL